MNFVPATFIKHLRQTHFDMLIIVNSKSNELIHNFDGVDAPYGKIKKSDVVVVP